MPEPILPQVKNIVFLMLENRSLDNLLGWLYKDSVPGYFYPDSPKQAQPFDGLVEKKFFNPDSSGNNFDVIPLPDAAWQSGSPVPFYDPYEALRAYPVDPRAPRNSWNGVMNQFFGNQQVIAGLPPTNGAPPKMKGFLQDYGDVHDILWTYTPAQAKVINALARQYAVSDRWFCSVPSDTSPNRAYSICGTSLGRESNLRLLAPEPPFWYPKTTLPHTIFNWLAGANKSWGLHFHDNYYQGKSYTEWLFPQMSPGGEIADFSRFQSLAASGGLPAFSYLEPTKWTTPGIGSWPATDGTDYHPNAHITPGEGFLQTVYSAITNGPQWKKNETLFIVTFDEHGGTFDHVPPTSGVNPDGKNGQENGFKFDLFGARVSTILISPFVRQGTVFRAPLGSKYNFDHTSFIATILKWAGIPLTVAAGQSQRVMVAPTFEGVFADHVVNSKTVTIEPHDSKLLDAARASRAYPAAQELSVLLEGIPVIATRIILSKSETLEQVQAEVTRYRQDPEKFEALIDKPPSS